MFSRRPTPMSRVILSSLLLCLVGLVACIDRDVEFYKQIASAMNENITITESQVGGIEAGSTPSLTCWVKLPSTISWTRDGIKLNSTTEQENKERLDIKNANRNDSGNYTCHAKSFDGDFEANKTIEIKVYERGRIVPEKSLRLNISSEGELKCHVYGDPVANFTWLRSNNTDSEEKISINRTDVTAVNATYHVMILKFKDVARKDNGTYTCQVSARDTLISAQTHLYVLDKPEVVFQSIIPVSTYSIYLNWTTRDWNSPVKAYYIYFMEDGSTSWTFDSTQISGNTTSHVLKGLKNSTDYQLRIDASNEIGFSQHHTQGKPFRTLDKDPVFVPNVTLKGSTAHSISISWNKPKQNLTEYIHYYELELYDNVTNTKKESMYPSPVPKKDMNIGYLFDELKAATTYRFRVRACSEYTKTCNEWSEEVNGTTLDGVSGPPQNFTVTCGIDDGTHYIALSWAAPLHPNGQIWQYRAKIKGSALYINKEGTLARDDMIVITKTFHENEYKSRIPNVSPNTNYTVSIAGLTKSMSPGEEAYGYCKTAPAAPNKVTDITWKKVQSDGKHFFQLHLPRVSERNGPICCYRIFMVKMEPQSSVAQLQKPKEIPLLTYYEVHQTTKSGAYLAEMFDSARFVPEIFLGDGQLTSTVSGDCIKCIGKNLSDTLSGHVLKFSPTNNLVRKNNIVNGGIEISTSPAVESATTIVSSTVQTDTTTAIPAEMSSSSSPNEVQLTDNGVSTNDSEETEKPTKRKRNLAEDSKSNAIYVEQRNLPHDGFLDDRSNYTGFVEFIVFGEERGTFITGYTPYFNPIFAGVEPVNMAATEAVALSVLLNVVLGITIIMIFLITLYLLHRFTKRDDQRGEEAINLRISFRHLCRSLRRGHQLVTPTPPDMPPILKADLLQAFFDRHRDSDYGFQHEFELLPDRFTDRTTRASETRENLYKNRYPDIKCYDQTRVKLTQIDGIFGSDYINANFVLGYKERKKFICAQGPMENTVCDYWRMIWEQHLELVLMLTNLEEYSKTKCAKYWPDKGETKNFGDITVEHVSEMPFSNYMVRELKMTRTGERETRNIIQYHFLVWKDFVAPEHPHAILRFIKRVNEAYSLEKGPILVHCSAGVGRTGTLVALDSLLQQLAEEGQVSIFNTVCDIRHQRNFLVQSLKQYIFIYRALVEMAQFGDTEIHANQLKTHVEKLRQKENGKEKCRMEEEYDKVNAVIEDRKSFSVGSAEENKPKNRSETVIPYDRNRVILTPIPGREHSTYINASFIEGYDNSESFIITQDPLDTTIPDFWRMISEQSITTIVMLSELAEGAHKCPRYWPDDEVVHNHIKVQYIQSESCPYYTRREFCVSNTKNDENSFVTQYQYNGWPTVEGEVPEVTRGLIELIDETQFKDTETTSGPLVVHCHLGSDRSSMFVNLSILVQQLRTEKRVDIFMTTKKLRSQRHEMINTFTQYEFLHRAIVNYLDLHKLADEETNSQ